MDTRDSSTATPVRRSDRHSRAQQRLVLLGVAFLFGGEAFCLLGSMRYERVVHFSCHAVFYTGAVLVCLGVALHWAAKRRP